MQKLDFTDVNKFFNAPLTKSSPGSFTSGDDRWVQQYYGRLHHNDGRSSSGSSRSSSSITLMNAEEQVIAAFNSHKYAWDDPVPDHQAQKGWSQVQAQLASSKVPSGYLPPPPLPPGVNPHAPPFVPSQQRQSNAPRPSHRQSSSTSSTASYRSSSPKPTWYTPFSDGTSTYSSDEHLTYATDLVSHRPWTPEALAELAQRFCFKGTKAMALGTATPRGVAIVGFLKAVIGELAKGCGDWYAGSFKWHLGECVLGTFKACYQSGFMTQKGTPVALSAVCTFLGCLFSHSILSQPPIQSCLALLLAEMSCIEHVQGIHAVLLNAGEQLWMGRDAGKALRDFVTSFTQRVSAMGNGTTSVKKFEVDKSVREVVDMLNRWHTARFMVPAGPSSRRR